MFVNDLTVNHYYTYIFNICLSACRVSIVLFLQKVTGPDAALTLGAPTGTSNDGGRVT